jgi:hypothetical protein
VALCLLAVTVKNPDHDNCVELLCMQGASLDRICYRIIQLWRCYYAVQACIVPTVSRAAASRHRLCSSTVSSMLLGFAVLLIAMHLIGVQNLRPIWFPRRYELVHVSARLYAQLSNALRLPWVAIVLCFASYTLALIDKLEPLHSCVHLHAEVHYSRAAASFSAQCMLQVCVD